MPRNSDWKFGVIRSALAALLLFGFTAEARAGLLDCPAEFTADGTAKVHDGAALPGVETAASACQYLDPPDNNNVANEANVNSAGFFSVSTWETVSGQVNSNASSGTWAISGANFAQFIYMITFKDGEGTNLISFLLNGEFSSGGWNTPFTNPPFTSINGGSKDVSHYSIFRSPTTTTVPEPGTLGLLSLGFVGLFSRRRRTA